jgi:two-component system sensor kinase FixL
MILDQEFKIVRVNAAAISFFNLPLEGVVGNHCYTLMHGTNEPVEICPLSQMMKTKTHEETELYDDKTKAWFHVSVDPILDDKGEITRAVHTVKDITERKRVEQEAFDARRELTRMERLSRMGELSASLSHELNQPLTAILSNARAALRFLQTGKLDPGELEEILQDIVKDDKRAGDIIRNLRAMVKPEEGEQELTSINDVLHETVALFRSEAIIRNVRIKMDLGDALPPVHINKVQIQQVLINLLTNAAESMTGGESAERIIVLQTVASSDGVVKVTVRDFGAGVEEQALQRIFEPFFTTKRSGLGMGLSLSRSIIESHGGHIWAENNPDKGITFYFDLPVSNEK